MSARAARERWFWAQARQRHGPCTLVEVVERVLGQPDPASVLVWRKGLTGWTRAEDVPELQGRLRAAGATEARQASGPSMAAAAPAPAPAVAPAGSALAVYGGLAAGIAVLALVAWTFWPRERTPTVVPLAEATAETAAAVSTPADPAPTVEPAPVPSGPGASAPATAGPASGRGPAVGGVAAQETTLPASELRKLRGVAAWSGEQLRLTVYNGTAWRVTEIEVRLSRFDGEDLVDDKEPVRLVPPRPAVDKGVADLLSKVAPDRHRPGVNALDTGPFEGRVGARPENFRWAIESARGYAPR